ncbi:DegT/DnrJ/EryC1/StrS family aminotransferase [Massilia brevitalea]|uniref:DegT/DnrJ/EryC1/StrS family aminotransferase n=1 Tax=Massilia brevitalea TaxID=442526 RepID=UPI0027383B6B|nr:DegT/DnrJ/EryC1/StrS aminotransferase family protein [Massilia brevitalea]
MSASSFRRAASAPARTVLDAGAHRLVTSGRVAIALALRELGVQAGDTVLVPAYHSPSMIPPVLWREATPVFYRVGPDAHVDLADLAARIDGRTRAVMVTHYFGFAQDMAPIRALCDAYGIALVEDCAHAFIGEHAGQPLGSWGDYAIASSMKFFPIYEGGALVSARRSLDNVRVHSAGAGFEMKAALNSLERGFAYGRLPAVQAALWLPLRAKGALWGLLKRGRRAPAKALAPDSSDSSFNFDPRWLDKRSSWFARGMLKLAAPARIQALRRRHYLRLDTALRGLPGIRPLHAQLPDGACPWVFPLLADDPEALFARLKALGVPLTRFGHPLWQDADTCPNAAMLARRVLSLPCHQELREQEVDWLVDAVRKAVLA